MSRHKKCASSNAAKRCNICGCTVAGDDSGWQTHTAGIRHRRNAASCRVFGEPGHHVVSAFEHVDGPPPPRYRGKDKVLLAAADATTATASSAAGCHTAESPAKAARGTGLCCSSGSTMRQNQQIQQLQVQLRKHLANHVGISSTYHRAVERFTLETLLTAWQCVQAQIAEQLQTAVLSTRATAAAPAAAAAAEPQQSQQQQAQQLQQQQAHPQQAAAEPQQQQQSRQQGAEKQQYQVQLCFQEPSQIACLAGLLPEAVHSLKLTVPYQSYGPAAAATSAAVACFMASLSHLQQLQRLELAFSCDDYARILRQGGGALNRLPELWGKVTRTAADAMRVNCGLLELTLTSYPGQFPPDELASLQSSLIESRQQLRTAVLLSTHSRLGLKCLLHQLPHEVMVMVVEAAVPKACKLVLQLPQRLDGSSSSSSESEISSDDSSSDSESGSDSENEG